MIKERCLHCINCYGATLSFATNEVVNIACGNCGPVDGPTIATGCKEYSPRPCCANCAHYRPQGRHEGGTCGYGPGGIYTVMTSDRTALVHLCKDYRPPDAKYRIDPDTGDMVEVHA